MYNPSRHGRTVKRQARNVGIGGIKHSEIIKKNGASSIIQSDISSKKRTKIGWEAKAFKNKSFEVYYEYFCSGNSIGTVINNTQDRFMRVLSGTVFVYTKKELVTLRSGQSITLPRKEEYIISTSAETDAEVIFCQSPNYATKLKLLSEPEIFTENTVDLSTQANGKLAIPPRRTDSKAQNQALKIKSDKISRRKRVVERANKPSLLSGQTVQGVNPRPIMPQAE